MGMVIFGDGTFYDRYTPVQVSISDVKSMSANVFHCIALKNDGTVWVWGQNISDPDFESYVALVEGVKSRNIAIPVRMPITNVTAVFAGRYHDLVLKDDGSLWAWGLNDDYQLGDGTNQSSSVPIKVPIDNVVSVSASEHNIALKNDRTVWTWGSYDFGVLGDGTSFQIPDGVTGVVFTGKPGIFQVQGLNNITGVYASSINSAALIEDGSVWMWGSNQGHQLGYKGGDFLKTMPFKVDISDVKKLALGDGHVLALKNDGTLWAWGENYNGELGIGVFAPGGGDMNTVIGPVKVSIAAGTAPKFTPTAIPTLTITPSVTSTTSVIPNSSSTSTIVSTHVGNSSVASASASNMLGNDMFDIAVAVIGIIIVAGSVVYLFWRRKS